MSLQQRVCFAFQHISSILSGSCDRSGSGTREWILILRMRYPILPNTKSRFWSMWRMNTVPDMDIYLSVNPKGCTEMISSPWLRLQDPVNLISIHTRSPAMRKNTQWLKMCLKWHPDEAITQHAYRQPQGSFWMPLLNHCRTRGKLIWLIIITTPTRWRSGVHFGYQISPTGSINRRKHIQSNPISPMWQATYFLSYLILLESRPVFPMGEMLSLGGRKTPQEIPFAKTSY